MNNEAKTILITGASSGIGEALAIYYARQQWQVIAGGRNEIRLQALTAQFNNIIPLVADICDEQQVQAAAQSFGSIDVMVLNAGHCEYINDPVAFDAALFKRVIDVNLMSVAYCLAHWLKHVKAGGQVAFTSSSAAFLPLPRAQAYGASKAALTYLAKTLSIDLAQHNIGVSIISPGFVKTPLTDKNTFAMPGIVSSEAAAKIIAHGIDKKHHQINFPGLFIFVLKCLNALPFSWWRLFAAKYLTRNYAS